MKLIFIKIIFYILAALFFYLGYKEIYPLIKNKFKLNYRLFIGLVYIGTSIAMLIRRDWLPMFIGAAIAFILKITDILDKQLQRKN